MFNEKKYVTPSENLGFAYREDGRTTAVFVFDSTRCPVDLPGRTDFHLSIEHARFCYGSKPGEQQSTLASLKSVSRPYAISFAQMNELMLLCQKLRVPKSFTNAAVDIATQRTSTPATGSTSLSSGILPGTKWCGVGDLASTYHDLGAELKLDKCCRTHDLCPVKVQANSKRYNLTNDSIYTKSHCTCDANLYKCLKDAKSQTADLMGNIYFNLLRVSCVQPSGKIMMFQSPNTY